jgi:mRNA-degrading endonuclease RelE of RelBE toxin-antitoxin system
MTHRIEFAKPAIKQFKALPPQAQQRLKPKIDALSQEPRPAGMVKLSEKDDLIPHSSGQLSHYLRYRRRSAFGFGAHDWASPRGSPLKPGIITMTAVRPAFSP